MLTSVTDECQLPGMRLLAAWLQRERFWIIFVASSFTPQRCWLRMLTPVTDECQLPGMRLLAA
ncbi:hypothetical protein [Rouxiella badensis]|uniref:hypothetical protein n=1 Tax=Rouxiella badensis TaxID=1646377 RepID=UPI00301C7E4C